jgi:hypothetical protein
LLKRLFRHQFALTLYTALLFLVDHPALGAYHLRLLGRVRITPVCGGFLVLKKRGSAVFAEFVFLFVFGLTFRARFHEDPLMFLFL